MNIIEVLKDPIELQELINRYNGYSLGKKYLSLTVNMWKEDIKLDNLSVQELYKDPTFPHWWLDKVFKKGV